MALPPLRLGLMFDRSRDPAGLPAFAATAEQAGAQDLWVVEDLGWNGGFTAATAALAATRTLRVGLGIAPAPYRNPALYAMEAATLGRLYPGRFVAGLGHGVTDWMADVGASAASPMALLEETVVAVRALLRGERVKADGREVRLNDVALVHVPDVPPPVFAAAVRRRTLELSGRVSQGTVIAEGHGPDDLTAIRGHLAAGGADAEHELVVFAFARIADDDRGSEQLAEMLAGQAAWLGRPAEQLFAVSGSAASAAEQIRSLEEHGATTVVLRFAGDNPLEQWAQVRAELG
ncbi:LLM class flavin-dependent oxidoreductase [Actinospica robiniae]|uniref:LLM class flavin-dependent oxidoreductase n=1 Tax=Actinospica robiniae TaxID=304901 RepID=UPI0004182746|nr:LLM class flavin-dependent oxidoreductase [Actinospica robiniae]